MKLEPIPKEQREKMMMEAASNPVSPVILSPVEERHLPVPVMEQNITAHLESMIQERLRPASDAVSSTPPPQTPLSRKPSIPAIKEEEHPEPPRPPIVNPWDIKTKPNMESRINSNGEDFVIERRLPVARDSPEDFISPTSVGNRRIAPSPGHLDQGADRIVQDQERRQRLPLPPEPSKPQIESPILGTILPAVPVAPKPRTSSFNPPPIRSSVVVGDMDSKNPPSQFQERYPSTSATGFNPARQRSIDSFHSSVLGTSSSSAGDNRASLFSNLDTSSVGSPPTQSPHLSISNHPPQIPPINPNGGLEQQPIIMEEHEGLIPVSSEPPTPAKPLVQRDTSITLSSSFYLQKGFCEGATEVIRGDIGVKKVKKPAFSGSATVGKCNHCFFELDWKEIELDVNGSTEANFSIDTIGFRVRFLQKSHVATRRSDEPFYGCVFCVHEGKTVHESDATIFFSQKELCDHLARHPRPLPNVPGVTVVEDARMPTHMKTNYDVHLRAAPLPNVADEMADEIAQRATATAKETVKRMYGMKMLHDRSRAFEMAAGSRVVGVEFPDKYQGEWCMGYHDGAYASFPLDVVRLDPPPTQEIRMGGVSNVTATARWKFMLKDKKSGDWLKFDKGEAIGNISCKCSLPGHATSHRGTGRQLTGVEKKIGVEKEHWCWSGTNAKGKWGIFPRAFIDEASVRELDDAERASIVSAGTTKSKGVLGRFSSRKSHNKEEVPALPRTVY